jgi:transcriptional regulator with XRE-family HTH domain
MSKGTVENEGNILAEVEPKAGPSTFGEYLKGLRKPTGLTIKDAAERIGISGGYLGKLESGGQGNPTLSVSFRLASVYGVDLNELGERQRIFLRSGQVENIKNLLGQQSTITWTGLEIESLPDEVLQNLEAFLDSIVKP